METFVESILISTTRENNIARMSKQPDGTSLSICVMPVKRGGNIQRLCIPETLKTDSMSAGSWSAALSSSVPIEERAKARRMLRGFDRVLEHTYTYKDIIIIKQVCNWLSQSYFRFLSFHKLCLKLQCICISIILSFVSYVPGSLQSQWLILQYSQSATSLVIYL